MKPLLLLAHSMEIKNFEGLCQKYGLRYLVTGVGAIRAAVTLSNFLSLYPEEKNLLHLGTAGIAGNSNIKSERLLEMATSHHFFLTDQKDEEYPDVMGSDWLFESFFMLKELKKVNVFSRLGISTIRQEFKGWENMEAIGLAECAHFFGANLNSVLVATNHVGPDGRSQWKNNYTAAGKQLAQFIEEFFE